MLKLSPWLVAAMMVLPVLLGLAAIVLPAFAYLPALGHEQLSLRVWDTLLQQPGLWHSVQLSLWTGLVTPLIALLVVMLFLASLQGTRGEQWLMRLLAPVLAIPHAAAALGLALLIAPSGLLIRLISPELTGWQRPPDLLIINDPRGLTMTAALIAKEIPFLLLMSLAALPQLDPARRLMMARSMGYRPLTGWLWTVAPALYPLIRLPLFAVIAYASSTVDVALILGPGLPAPLSVRVIGWFNDPDLDQRLLASAAALLQLGISVLVMLLWLGLEHMARWLWRAACGRGWRSAGHRALGFVGRTGMILALGTLALSVMILLMLAFTGNWRFPQAWPGSWTLQHWHNALPGLRTAVSATLWLAVSATAASLLLVIATLEQQVRSGQQARLLTAALYVPLLVPQVAFLFGLTLLSESAGWPPGLPVVASTHVLFVLPYLYLSLSEAYRRLDPRWAQLAASLGCSRWRSFWQIRVPMLTAPLLTATAIGIAVSAGLYLPTLLMGAGRVTTVTTEAVALASGAARQPAAVWALIQTLIPMTAFALALALPRLRWRHRRGMQGVNL